MTNETKPLLHRLRMAQCSSCSCLTKTPQVSYHDPDCLYRVLSEAITALTAAPAEDVRAVVDEPVAWVNPSNLARFKGDIGATAYQCADHQIPLYRHTQRPVVMPERKPVVIGLDSESNSQNKGWNACLDEFARLNE